MKNSKHIEQTEKNGKDNICSKKIKMTLLIDEKITNEASLDYKIFEGSGVKNLLDLNPDSIIEITDKKNPSLKFRYQF